MFLIVHVSLYHYRVQHHEYANTWKENHNSSGEGQDGEEEQVDEASGGFSYPNNSDNVDGRLLQNPGE